MSFNQSHPFVYLELLLSKVFLSDSFDLAKIETLDSKVQRAFIRECRANTHNRSSCPKYGKPCCRISRYSLEGIRLRVNLHQFDNNGMFIQVCFCPNPLDQSNITACMSLSYIKAKASFIRNVNSKLILSQNSYKVLIFYKILSQFMIVHSLFKILIRY